MDRLDRKAATVVGYGDVDQAPPAETLYVHFGCYTRRFSSVQRIVDQLFQDYGGEFVARLTGLG
jgi:hypothetical protein